MQIRNPGEKLYRKSYFRRFGRFGRFRRYRRYRRYEQDVTDVTDVTYETSEDTFHIQFFTRIPNLQSVLHDSFILVSFFSSRGFTMCMHRHPPPRSSHLDGAFTAHQRIGVTRDLQLRLRPHPAYTPCECGGMRRRWPRLCWRLMEPPTTFGPAL